MPYTPMDDTASTNSTPMFRSVSCMKVRWPATAMSGPKGITEIDINAIVMARNGAPTYSSLFT